MIRLILTLALLCSVLFVPPTLHANETNNKPLSYGHEYQLDSKLLEHTMTLQVYLPESYDTSEKSYPVVYVLDGQWHFINAVAVQKSLRVPDALPEMIVVGIVTPEPIRRDWFGNKRAVFQQSLNKEILPFIQSNVRASNDTVLFGWEMGAFFATYSLFEPQDLFSGFIATNGGNASKESISAFNKRENQSEKYLYLVNSTRDIFTISYSEQLNENLTEISSKNLNWRYQTFNDETHESLPYVAMYEGLKFYFHNYKDLAFATIKEYQDLGGLDYLTSYFAKRGKRFGFPLEISNSTKNHLIWLAWNRDDYKHFQLFMEEFKDVLSTKRYDSAYWQNRFGRFYLKHGNTETAKSYFEKAIVKYPESAKLYEGLSQVNLALNKKTEAKKNLEQAIDIAASNSASDLEQYKQKLKALADN